MSVDRFSEMKAYVSFTEADARALAELKPLLRPFFAEIVGRFSEAIARTPGASAVVEAGDGRIENLEQSLTLWLSELLGGKYDEAYAENRANIGRMHVRAKLPQHYIFTAMNIIRSALTTRIEAVRPVDVVGKIAAVHKILDLDLALMNGTYMQDMVRRVRIVEHSEYEQKISESEHLATIGQLAASLAHEIKNPLAGISGAIQVLGGGLDQDHPHQEVIQEVLRQIDRLDDAVKDLLIYARPKPPERRPTNLSKTLERAMILFRQEPAFRKVQVVCEGMTLDHIAEVDETQIQQVISNLMLNAAHACERGGTVTCRIARGHGVIRTTIEDDGIGIPPDVLPRVFEPFFTTKARGTGLGLPICKRIVEVHGGTLAIESEVGAGTKVVMEIPE